MFRNFLVLFMVIYSTPYSKGIQLNSIPGQSKDMDIGNLLEQIMYPYQEEIRNIKDKIRDIELEQRLWDDFKLDVSKFDQVNKFMVGHESPFRSVTHINSHPELLEVKTQRTAYPGKYEISVLQLASPHSFASASIDPKINISAGNFSVNVSEQEHSINFPGGSLDDLVQVLKTELDGKVRIKTVSASEDEKILTMSSVKEGVDSTIQFSGDLQPLKDIKLLEKNKDVHREIIWAHNMVQRPPQSFLEQTIGEAINTPLFLIFDVSFEDFDIDSEKKEIKLESLSYSNLGTIENEMFSVPGSKPLLENVNATSPPREVEKKDSIVLIFDDSSEEIFDLTAQSYKIPLESHKGKNLKKIKLSANKKIKVSENLILSKNPMGDLSPSQEISNGQNAKILLDGIEIERSSNAFSNVIPGVVLSLLKEEPETKISVNIRHNLEMIEETIIQWVKTYNTVMEEIFLLGTIPIKKIGKLKPLHKREKDGDDLKEGVFYGNFNLRTYKDRLRQLIGMPHTRIEGNLSLLDQIGIYINRKNAINTDPQVLQKGTITLDTNELNDALNSNFEQVYQLFAHDTDGDNIADKGAAVSALNIDKIMLGESGFINRNEIMNIDKIRQLSAKITKKEEDMEKVEIKERKALLEMNKAISESKSLSESLKQRL